MIPAFQSLGDDHTCQQLSWSIQFVLTTIVLAWPGRASCQPVFPGAVKRTPDMKFRSGLSGATAAWGFSTLALFAPSCAPLCIRLSIFEAQR